MAYFKFALIKLLSLLSVGFVSVLVFAGATDQSFKADALLSTTTYPPAQTLLPDGRVLEVGRLGGRLGADVRSSDGTVVPLTLRVPRQAATATVLPDGRTLIWGGIDSDNKIVTTGEWFDPATNTIREANGISLTPRAGHTATVLTDGHLLMVAGVSAPPATGRAELWDFRANTTEALADGLAPARLARKATLMSDGRVLIFGGRDAVANTPNEAVFYDPRRAAFVDVDAHAATAALDEVSSIPPSVIESIPADQAIGVPLDEMIAFRFSTPMDVTTLSSDTVTLIGPAGSTSIRITPAEGGRLVFVEPESDLIPGSNYSLFIDGARGANGLPLAFSGMGFTTEGGEPAAGQASSAASNKSSGSSRSSSVPIAGGNASKSGGEALQAVSTTGIARLTTGTPKAIADFMASCTNARAIHGHRFCRDTGSVVDGVFIPGHSNTQARWRLNLPEPEILKSSDLPEGSITAGVTTLYGTVRRIDDKPLANATVAIGKLATQTDKQGRFVLTKVPSGHQVLLVDGSSANQNDAEYGQFFASVSIVDGKANAVPYNLYVPRITARDKVAFAASRTTETVISHPTIPGLEIHIPAGTVIRDRNGHVLTELAVVPLPVDRSPVPLPANFPVYFSVQPATAMLQGVTADASKGVRIVYPNYLDSTQGKAHAFWLYDPNRDGWMVYADGHATSDESQVVPDSAVGANVPMPGGYSVWGPSPPFGPPPCGNACCMGGSGGGHPFGLGGGPILDGDPVECSSGLFLHTRTDIAIKDILPISVTHTYRPNESTDFAFGRGTNHNYGVYLYSPSGSAAPPELDLVLSDGSKVPFFLVSGNLGQGGPGLWVSQAFPSEFYGARLINNETQSPCGVCVVMQDGTTLVFPVSASTNAPSWLQAIIDRFGNRITMQYTAGLLTRVTSPGGRTLTYSYNSSNFISQVADQTGRAVSYIYSGDQLQKITFPDNTTEQYTYDANGRMQTVIDRRGNTKVTNQYNSSGAVIQQTLPDGVYKWSYTVSGSRVTTDITDPRNNVRHVTFDSSGYPTSVTSAYGKPIAQTTTYIRGQNELVTAKTDALGRQTQVLYDGNGNVVKKTYLAGTSNAVSYSYTYTQDGLNQLLSATDPLGHTTNYGYTNGCLTSITDPLGHTTQIACNSLGQPVAVTDPNGNSTILTYNGTDLHTVTNALGKTWTTTTDPLGRVTAMQDPLSNTTQLFYDVNDVDDRVQKSIDALHQTTLYSYDGNGNLLSVTDPNTGKTQFTYDARNRKVVRTDALNQSESWAYDGMGNVLTYIDRKQQKTSYQYDELNRNLLTTFADGSTITPTFDAGNRLTTVVDSVSGTITRSYDGFDRLTQEQTPQGTVSYGYDPAGRRTTMNPGSQSQIGYTYDDADRLTQIAQGSETVGFSYDAANRRMSLTLPNGVITTYSYDAADQVASMTYTSNGGTSLASLAYTYDAAGQRLSQAGGFSPVVPPSLSAGGNTFDLNNRQTQANGQSISYDANGDPSVNNASAQSYSFDARHRLTQVQQGGSAIATFSYDAFGRRTGKTVNGTTTNFLYDGQNAVQEMQGGTIYSILSGLGIDQRFARSEPAGRRYFAADALGSTVALTDSNAAVQQTYSYEPYGEMQASGSSNNPYQCTGRENDGIGLLYYRARYYNPTFKRFISEDSIGLSGGLNLYGYISSSPINGTDPTGKASMWGCAVGGLAAVGVAGIGCAVTGPGEAVCLPAGAGLILSALGCAGGAVVVPAPSIGGTCENCMLSDWPGDKGAEEWGRRNGYGADVGRRRFHKIKQDCKGRPKDVWVVDPETGDVKDPEGETQGNLGDSGSKQK